MCLVARYASAVPLHAQWRFADACLCAHDESVGESTACTDEVTIEAPRARTLEAWSFERRPSARVDPTEPAPDVDLTVARGALAREPQAVDRLVARMRVIARILSVLNVRLGWPLDNDELADVAQDTTILAWTKLDTFTGVSTLETWFYGIARNKFLSAVRSKTRRSQAIEDTDLAPLAESDGVEPDVERLRLALARLPRDEARVVTLYYYEGLTLDQVAERVGAASSTVKSRYYRGLDRIVDFLRGRAAVEER
jgi:RNA polymerase sigma factor (sigma-70 family)